jgi:hypothetical protein
LGQMTSATDETQVRQVGQGQQLSHVQGMEQKCNSWETCNSTV